MREKPGFPAHSEVSWETWYWNAWLRWEDSNFEGQIRNQTLSPAGEKWQNLFPPDLLSGFKRWNFENRTKWTESRASERNGHFGEQ
jgi:hypothetical protein